MKFYPPIILLSLFLAFVSCKPAETKVEEPIPAADFNLMMVKHPVADFAVWKGFYDGHDSVRVSYGVHNFHMGRGVEDSSMVMIVNKCDDVAKAKSFGAMPELKEIMQAAGVTGPPEVSFVHIVRDDNRPIDSKVRVMVSHHVKDFDAWLKIFDAEGPTTRASYGMVDRALGRGIDDPNMVYMVFALTDPDKAQARFKSPDLKKIMEDAGVDSEPQAFAFSIVY